MLFASLTPELASHIAAGAGVHDQATYLAIKEEAERWKPAGLDPTVIALRHQYEGKIAEQLRAYLLARYKHTGARMPLLPFGWASLYANNGASVYDYPPSRYLKRDGKKLDANDEVISPEDKQRAEDFATMAEEAHLEVQMAEAERRVTLTNTVFIRVHSDSIKAIATDSPPVTSLTLFWANDVLVLPHPRCPASLETAIAIMARVSADDGVNGGSEQREVWTRGFEEDEDGNVVRFLPWRVELVTERKVTTRSGFRGMEVTETKVTIRPVKYRSPDGSSSDVWPLTRLPWIVWHSGVADGCPFLDANRNLAELFNAASGSMGNEQFTSDMNASTILVRTSDVPTPDSIVLGPGAMATIRGGETITPIPMGADFEGMRAGTNAIISTMAMTSRQSASDYDAQQTQAPSSGTALRIKNQALEKARIEAIARAREVENRLLPVMAEIHDHWRATSIMDKGIAFAMEPQDPPDYEDREITQRRAIDAKDAGLISEARAAVVSGYYRTEDEAKVAIEKIRTERAANPSPMRQALDAIATDPRKTEQPVEQKPAEAPKLEITVNELTLGIERMGRLKDFANLNILREQLAGVLGVPYEGDFKPKDAPAKPAFGGPK